MERLLRQIYDDLSHGRLSQVEALEKVKAIKLQERGSAAEVLLAVPVWRAGEIEAEGNVSLEYARHYVLLCDRSAADAEKLASLLPGTHCVSLHVEQMDLAQRYSHVTVACFERIQAILRSDPHARTLVQVVVTDDEEHALAAGVSGLLETAALENPGFTGQLILIGPEMTAEELAARLEGEASHGTDPLVRYQGGDRQILDWQEMPVAPEPPPVAFKDSGVYLITGGLGGLGVLFAQEIIAQAPQATVVLTGRSELSVERQARLDGSFAAPNRVTYRQVELGDRDQVRHLITSVKDEYGRIDGILHCAGMIADNFILKKSTAELRDVLAPKVTGTINLDRASRDVELDFFVLFSSFAGALGNLGQGDYAAANGFMDRFAAYRNRQVAAQQRHGRTRSINWALWQDGGIRLDTASQERLQQATGMQPMHATTGVHAFYRSLSVPCDQMLVMEGELTLMRRALAGGRPVEPQPSSLPPLAAMDPQGLFEKTEEYLRRECARLLKLPSHKIDPESALERYGIDSILALKLTSELEKTFGVLSKTLFFEYQTLRDLSRYFVQSHAARLIALFPETDGRPQAADLPSEPQPAAPARRIAGRRASRARDGEAGQAESEAIAIIGLSGRYPEAIDLEAYWRNLRDGRDCIIEVPKERWDWREYFSEDRTAGGHHYSKWGGFIAGVDEFDPLFFNISPKEAKYLDPQERLFLQHAWMAIEDAGYTRARLQMPTQGDLPGQVGVYAGVMYSEYQLFGAEASAQGKRVGVPGSAASIANRVSYALNLHGPSMTLDTMCSSSLTAIHTACQDLKQGRTSLAIAGGVNVSIHPNKYLVLSGGQFISSDGHCQSFGEGGDGYIPGEGVGVVVLKRFSEAKRDGDHIYGAIRGSSLNHGGKTNGYTVPNPQAQATAISRALAESRTDARHISYIEAHGTGTKLGDPIEITALTKAFQPYTQETGFCLIGSAKSNIGHCESAAGIAGLTKVLLQMQHQQIAPSLHSAQLNPHIDFGSTPFVVNQSLKAWEQPVLDGRKVPRIAGISSFGAGGSNAHVIVEEYQQPVPQPVAYTNLAILLSARTVEQLQQKVRDLLDFITPRLDTIDLAAVAYTLQTGREAMDERLGFIVSSTGQLAEKLQAYLAGEQELDDVCRGQVKRDRQSLSMFSSDPDLQKMVDQWLASGKLARLLELWVTGVEIDWSELYGESTPQRISLPTYPFAKERYWIDIDASGQGMTKRAAAILHPLLHSNTSDLSQQSYSATFSGDEFFLQQLANGQRVLPAAAYLEMARAAVQVAS
ncbi:MAG TPA: SDR family NAD(P)-dependent oxidoreductase, partial [Thermoanaerobaculia bacterium]|nr:SDR family NAD(P)-dependent oxidoreductase [Thermoanaerobaculia bacterium]